MSDLTHAFQSQLSGVMETVFKAAIFEITRLVEESFMKEMSRSREQVETLKKRLQWSESRWRTQESTCASRCTKCGKANEEDKETSTPLENDRGLKQESVRERSWGSCELETDTLLGKERSEDRTSPNRTAEQSANTEDRKLDCILKEEVLYNTTDKKELQDGWTLDTEVAETSDFSAHSYSEQELQQIQEEWSTGLVKSTDDGPYADITDVQGLAYRMRYNTEELADYNKLDMGDLNVLGERTEETLGAVQNDLNVAIEGERHFSNKSKKRNRGSFPAQVNPETESIDRHMHCLLINEEGHLQDMSALSEVQNGVAGHADHRGHSTLYGENTANDGSGGLYKEHEFNHSQDDRQIFQVSEPSLKDYPLSQRVGSTDAYNCNQCGKKFTQACNLKVHQRVHQRDGLHLCSHCGKGYSSFSDLQRHRCSQTGEKPYICTLCGNRFSRLWNLKLHRRIHTQEKPHQCTVCNKSFTRADILKVHQRTHTGERPYCCGICGLSFKRLDHLRSHQRKHSADLNSQ
ncbi:uncharacterized protein [Misgurnus anguillicaudatus]|uniref:uncharacterized protein isoform X1 n=1 Tax=Misgurnus anguillicaudatus TaxID=75329 RepID=UPI003CCF5ECA